MNHTTQQSQDNDQHSIFSTSDVGRIAVNLTNFSIIDANDIACQLLGYTRATLLQKSYTELDMSEVLDTPGAKAKFIEDLPRHNSADLRRAFFRNADKSFSITKYNASIDENGVEPVANISFEVTESCSWRTRFERILTGLPYGVVELDLEDNILYADQKMADLLGLERGELVGHNISEFHVREVDKRKSLLNIEQRRKGVSGSFKAQFKHSNGSQQWLFVQAMPLFDNDEVTGVLGFHLELPTFNLETFNHLNLEEETLIDPIDRMRFASLIEGQENERVRISKDIHDGLGQSLLSSIRTLNQITRHNKDQSIAGSLRELKNQISIALDETRRVSRNLSPAVLIDFGVAEALQNHIESQATPDISISFKKVGLEGIRFDKIIETTFYRVAQEAISNAVRHSLCTNIVVTIQLKNLTLSLVVMDDGVGIRSNTGASISSGGQGLSNMYARADTIGAALEIKSGTGGVTVSLSKLIDTL